MLSLKSQKKQHSKNPRGRSEFGQQGRGREKTSSKHDSHFKLINYHDGTIIGKLWQGFGEF